MARVATLLLAAGFAVAPTAVAGPDDAPERVRAQEWRPAFAAAERYARTREGRVSIALVDDTGRLRRHRSARRFSSASLVKAMLLVAYLDRLGDRRLRAADDGLLRPMVVRSGNRAAGGVLAIVGHAGLERVARRAGMTRFEVRPGWANTQVTAADQARLFIRIDRLVPSRHRSYARRLLRDIIDRQRWGMPRAIPGGARIFFKGGWRPGAGGWMVHQAALVERGDRRVALAVLTDRDRDREYGRATIRGIAKRVLRPLEERGAESPGKSRK